MLGHRLVGKPVADALRQGDAAAANDPVGIDRVGPECSAGDGGDLHGDLDSLDGDIYVEAHKVEVKQWNRKFKLLPEYLVDTNLDINLWLTVEDNNVEALTTQFTARNLSIKNNSTSKSWETDSLSANIRYINDEGHWSIAVADLYFGDESRYAWPESANIIASDDGENYYLSADFLRVGDLQEMAQIFLDKEKLSDFNKLKAYKIQADIYNLSLQLPKRSSGQKFLDELYLQVSVNDFSLHDKANDIDLSGLDTTLIFENGQAVLDLASHHTKVELPKLFRDPLFVNTLHGKITLADQVQH